MGTEIPGRATSSILYSDTFDDLDNWDLTTPSNTSIAASSNRMNFTRDASASGTVEAELNGYTFGKLPLAVIWYMSVGSGLPTQEQMAIRLETDGGSPYLIFGLGRDVGNQQLFLRNNQVSWTQFADFGTNALWFRILLRGDEVSIWYNTNAEGSEPAPGEWTQRGSAETIDPPLESPLVKAAHTSWGSHGAFSGYISNFKVVNGY